MKYFKNVKTLEELKKEYKKQVKNLHPDNGGDAEEFKKMQADYKQAFELVKNKHQNSQGEYYEKETTETAEEFMEILEHLNEMQGVVVEVCGSWLWMTGNTKAYKKELKALGCGWSRKKQAWYYHKGSYRKQTKVEWTLEEIREKFENSKTLNKNLIPA